jgi:ubiquinone/menaquinone biosynthesis C-methylase UbiE
MYNTLIKKYSYNSKTFIFGNVKNSNFYQKKEFTNRKKLAIMSKKKFLNYIANHHSIPVMDKEVNIFLKNIPTNSIICDIGGGWGWHWRNIKHQRPDVKVIIIDFIYENLLIAKKILKNNINKQIFLINDDCCKLKLKKKIFEAVWTVQTLQHIPKFSKVVKVIYNLLKTNGVFYNYNFNLNYIIKIIFKIFNKKYLEKGYSENFYLERSCLKQKKIIEKIFKTQVFTRYTELLFHPELKLKTGSKNNFIGKIDSNLSGDLIFKKLFARQECFYVKKISI